MEPVGHTTRVSARQVNRSWEVIEPLIAASCGTKKEPLPLAEHYDRPVFDVESLLNEGLSNEAAGDKMAKVVQEWADSAEESNP